MSNKQKFGKDNWLYIFTNAIANYVDEGGLVVVVGNGEISIILNEVEPGDPRLHPDFAALIKEADYELFMG